MKWLFPGGEVELEGPVFKKILCPLDIVRSTGGGDLAIGQPILIFNLTSIRLVIDIYGIKIEGAYATAAGTTLAVKAQESCKGVVSGPSWLIRIVDWDGRGRNNWGSPYWSGTVGGYTLFSEYEKSKPRLPAKPVVNPLDASRAKRKLL